MKHVATLTLAAMILAVTPPAFAQMGGPAFKGATELSAEESRLLWASIHGVLADYAVGATKTWSDAATKRAGSATILRTFTRDGLRCAEVQHSFTQGSGAPYTFPFCQVSDGSWKIAP